MHGDAYRAYTRARLRRARPRRHEMPDCRGRLCAHATERFRLIAASFSRTTDSITGSLVSRGGRETVVNKIYVVA